MYYLSVNKRVRRQRYVHVLYWDINFIKAIFMTRSESAHSLHVMKMAIK